MKRQYCWRCDADVPMLDEGEYAYMLAIYEWCVEQWTSDWRRRDAAPPPAPPPAERYRPVQEAYARLTGGTGLDASHILTHRIAAYGPPCVYCGRPLRTPDAMTCGSCGRSPP